jgi:hypothetical protein
MLVRLSLDFGGSGMKGIGSNDNNAFAFRIAPEIIEMIGEPPVLNGEFAIDLTKNMWVGSGENRHAVGVLARTEYYASIPLVQPKANYVVPRTLAAVAVAMEKFKLTKCEVALQLLFPSAEFERTDFNELVQALKAALLRFESPTGQLRAKLKLCTFHPEGWGLTRRYMHDSGDKINGEQIACIMFGHRNTSLYICDGGQPKHYRSNNLGFIRAIESAKLDQLQGLSDPSLVDQQSLDKYWSANKNWLGENLPSTVSIAVIGGGPLASIGDNLTSYLSSRLPTGDRWASDVVALNGGMSLQRHHYHEDNSQILKRWPRNLGIPESDHQAFCDVYCLWATDSEALPWQVEPLT